MIKQRRSIKYICPQLYHWYISFVVISICNQGRKLISLPEFLNININDCVMSVNVLLESMIIEHKFDRR